MTDQKDINRNKQDPNKQEDEAIWAFATKDVTPLNKNNEAKRKKPQERKEQKAKKNHQKFIPEPIKSATKSYKSSILSTELDTRTAQKLKRGQYAIDQRIDLHGMSKNQAYDTLQAIIPNAYVQGKRCLLVITGKGKPKSGDVPLHAQEYGVLKTITPQWLREAPLAQYVLRIEIAKPKDGGSGALYVLLRRKR